MTALMIPELLLGIAEHADMETIFALMLTCRNFHAILQRYQYSVTKAQIQRYRQLVLQPAVPTGKGGDGKTSQHAYCAPYDTVLTSAQRERRILKPASAAVVRELELRESRIRAIFGDIDGPLAASINIVLPGLLGESQGHRRRLMARLRRASRLTDRLADCTVDVILRSGLLLSGSGSSPDCHGPCGKSQTHEYRGKYDFGRLANAVLDNTAILSVSLVEPHNATHLDKDYLLRKRDPSAITPPRSATAGKPQRRSAFYQSVSRAIRSAQLFFIQSLPLIDLVFLCLLARISGLEWRKYWALERQLAQQEQGLGLAKRLHLAEEAMAFKETVLRQGTSMALWGLVGHNGRGGTPPPAAAPERFIADGVMKSVEEVLVELAAWEMDDELEREDAPAQNVGIEILDEEDVEDDIWGDVERLQPGLHMAMMGKIGDEIGQRGPRIFVEIEKLVLEAIKEPCGEYAS